MYSRNCTWLSWVAPKCLPLILMFSMLWRQPYIGIMFSEWYELTLLLGFMKSCVLVQMFQQKWNRDKDRHKEFKGKTGTHDPPMISPWTIELSRGFLEEWEAKYNEAHDSTAAKMSQTSQSTKGKGRKVQSNYEDPCSGAKEDIVEAGMKGPNLALDACRVSFVAVDGDCIKASMKYFKDTDTGLMAVLCHHDWPLFLANMWMPGQVSGQVNWRMDWIEEMARRPQWDSHWGCCPGEPG